jgi:hypothetical protein
VDGTDTVIRELGAAPGETLFLRVVRSGNTYTMYHSGDGVAWTTVDATTVALSINSVGVYAANPVFGVAYTAEIDYVEHVAVPLTSEDAELNTLTISTVGEGSVDADPPLGAYSCGDTVALTATPDPGWWFTGWSGDHSGMTNPDTIIITGPMSVTATFTTTTAVGDDSPVRYELIGARPNPFNTTTQILFQLPAHTDVRIDIYDVRGRHIRRLVDESMPPSEHAVVWDGRNDQGTRVGTGVYFYHVRAGEIDAARRIVLLR